MAIDNWEFDKTDDSAVKSTGFEKVKTVIADKLHGAAEGLCKNVEKQDGEPGTTNYRKQASEWLDHSAEYVRTFDYKEADAGIREYVRQSPGRSLFIAGAVGLMIGALLRRR